MRLYLAGPMTGHPEFNFPLFLEVTSALRDQGYEVDCPAEHDLSSTPGITWEPGYATGDVSKTRLFDSRAAFRWDFAQIIEGDAIALLPGWETSAGAQTERLVAEKTGKLVLLVRKLIPVQPSGWHEEHPAYALEADPIQCRMFAGILLSEGLK